MKQGYLKSGTLYIYDVASCYPAAIVELPSLRPDQGEWKRLALRICCLIISTNCSEDRKDFDGFIVPSLRWKFPIVEKLSKPPANMRPILKSANNGKGCAQHILPFFPLPYRSGNRRYPFPFVRQSICTRDDLIAAIKVDDEIYVPGFPGKKSLDGQQILFEIDGAWIWEEIKGAVRPLAFIRDYYDQRRADQRRCCTHGRL